MSKSSILQVEHRLGFDRKPVRLRSFPSIRHPLRVLFIIEFFEIPSNAYLRFGWLLQGVVSF